MPTSIPMQFEEQTGEPEIFSIRAFSLCKSASCIYYDVSSILDPLHEFGNILQSDMYVHIHL